MKPRWLSRPITWSWLTQARPPSAADRQLGLFVAVLLPTAAACIQSAWIVFVRGIRLYQAMLGGESGTIAYAVLTVQAAISICVLWPLLRYAVLHRLAALLLFGGWLYLDFEMNSAVIH